jgi:hypothetical protein
MENLLGYISSAEAARMKGYADGSTYRLWAREGRIPGAIKAGRDWLLPRAWVDAQPLFDGRGGPGGPRGKGSRRKNTDNAL